MIACHADAQPIVQNKITDYVAAGVPQQTLILEPLDSVGQWIQHPQISAVLANSEGLDSRSLRQTMAQRDGAIIPLIQWPLSNEGYHYSWFFQLLQERTRTENLVARGGNTQLFSLEENLNNSPAETV